MMTSGISKSVRSQEDLEVAKCMPTKPANVWKFANKFIGAPILEKIERFLIGKIVHRKVLSRVFSEDYEKVDKTVLDPRGHIIRRWNRIFLVACLVSLFVDPLFFFLPSAKEDMCLEVSIRFRIVLTIIRSLVDLFYFIQIFVRFRTAYVASSSRVFGRGELVVDPSKIASRYIQREFWLDMVAAQPLPQVLVWAVIPSLLDSCIQARNVLRLSALLQYLIRLYLIFPLSSKIVKDTGVVMETAWAGAAYNLMLYMLASHVVGSCWYLFAVERQEGCWRKVCTHQDIGCRSWSTACHVVGDSSRAAWLKLSNISSLCVPTSDFYQFGIYADALTFNITGTSFLNKYFYSLWWGLRSLSSLGQNLLTSTYVGEICFSIFIAILGLVFFALLIGNMQTYLQSTTRRLEEWRIKRTDTEQWMHHRQLPRELRLSVRKYDQYRWTATHGVDEESILKCLPMDLRRDIKRHLCLDLIRKVPLFDSLDDQMLDVICERLKTCLCTRSTCLVREGDPVNEMFFIVRGHLDSCTTDGGRAGFFNSCRIVPGDFCGEELLTWALDPHPSVVLPSSTRTVKAITEVEAFALIAEDLKFVASQFRRLHSKKLRHTFRFHSHQWRAWAACFIQASWFRYKRRKEAAELKKMESIASMPEPTKEQKTVASLSTTRSSLATYAAILAASTRRGGSIRCGADYEILGALQKPSEPDFTAEHS
ncbi:protein CNGC15b-like [Tripterygium wilfordii]|uniref:protein CNGC15b-like n=1 Tax=Tripterygium wilfordii TaxID=458696 RepID=UPI0018F83EF7|nr:protein CNGC15b-like [Tripterygium wilfordii]